jgi:hypothetical protein
MGSSASRASHTVCDAARRRVSCCGVAARRRRLLTRVQFAAGRGGSARGRAPLRKGSAPPPARPARRACRRRAPRAPAASRAAAAAAWKSRPGRTPRRCPAAPGRKSPNLGCWRACCGAPRPCTGRGGADEAGKARCQASRRVVGRKGGSISREGRCTARLRKPTWAARARVPGCGVNPWDAGDPEMHQTKKGNQWYFGMKVHAGVDKDSGLIHSVVVTGRQHARPHPSCRAVAWR